MFRHLLLLWALIEISSTENNKFEDNNLNYFCNYQNPLNLLYIRNKNSMVRPTNRANKTNNENVNHSGINQNFNKKLTHSNYNNNPASNGNNRKFDTANKDVKISSKNEKNDSVHLMDESRYIQSVKKLQDHILSENFIDNNNNLIDKKQIGENLNLKLKSKPVFIPYDQSLNDPKDSINYYNHNPNRNELFEVTTDPGLSVFDYFQIPGANELENCPLAELVNEINLIKQIVNENNNEQPLFKNNKLHFSNGEGYLKKGEVVNNQFGDRHRQMNPDKKYSNNTKDNKMDYIKNNKHHYIDSERHRATSVNEIYGKNKVLNVTENDNYQSYTMDDKINLRHQKSVNMNRMKNSKVSNNYWQQMVTNSKRSNRKKNLKTKELKKIVDPYQQMVSKIISYDNKTKNNYAELNDRLSERAVNDFLMKIYKTVHSNNFVNHPTDNPLKFQDVELQLTNNPFNNVDLKDILFKDNKLNLGSEKFDFFKRLRVNLTFLDLNNKTTESCKSKLEDIQSLPFSSNDKNYHKSETDVNVVNYQRENKLLNENNLKLIGVPRSFVKGINDRNKTQKDINAAAIVTDVTNSITADIKQNNSKLFTSDHQIPEVDPEPINLTMANLKQNTLMSITPKQTPGVDIDPMNLTMANLKQNTLMSITPKQTPGVDIDPMNLTMTNLKHNSLMSITTKQNTGVDTEPINLTMANLKQNTVMSIATKQNTGVDTEPINLTMANLKQNTVMSIATKQNTGVDTEPINLTMANLNHNSLVSITPKQTPGVDTGPMNLTMANLNHNSIMSITTKQTPGVDTEPMNLTMANLKQNTVMSITSKQTPGVDTEPINLTMANLKQNTVMSIATKQNTGVDTEPINLTMANLNHNSLVSITPKQTPGVDTEPINLTMANLKQNTVMSIATKQNTGVDTEPINLTMANLNHNSLVSITPKQTPGVDTEPMNLTMANLKQNTVMSITSKQTPRVDTKPMNLTMANLNHNSLVNITPKQTPGVDTEPMNLTMANLKQNSLMSITPKQTPGVVIDPMNLTMANLKHNSLMSITTKHNPGVDTEPMNLTMANLKQNTLMSITPKQTPGVVIDPMNLTMANLKHNSLMSITTKQNQGVDTEPMNLTMANLKHNTLMSITIKQNISVVTHTNEDYSTKLSNDNNKSDSTNLSNIPVTTLFDNISHRDRIVSLEQYTNKYKFTASTFLHRFLLPIYSTKYKANKAEEIDLSSNTETEASTEVLKINKTDNFKFTTPAIMLEKISSSAHDESATQSEALIRESSFHENFYSIDKKTAVTDEDKSDVVTAKRKVTGIILDGTSNENLHNSVITSSELVTKFTDKNTINALSNERIKEFTKEDDLRKILMNSTQDYYRTTINVLSSERIGEFTKQDDLSNNLMNYTQDQYRTTNNAMSSERIGEFTKQDDLNNNLKNSTQEYISKTPFKYSSSDGVMSSIGQTIQNKKPLTTTKEYFGNYKTYTTDYTDVFEGFNLKYKSSEKNTADKSLFFSENHLTNSLEYTVSTGRGSETLRTNVMNTIQPVVHLVTNQSFIASARIQTVISENSKETITTNQEKGEPLVDFDTLKFQQNTTSETNLTLDSCCDYSRKSEMYANSRDIKTLKSKNTEILTDYVTKMINESNHLIGSYIENVTENINNNNKYSNAGITEINSRITSDHSLKLKTNSFDRKINESNKSVTINENCPSNDTSRKKRRTTKLPNTKQFGPKGTQSHRITKKSTHRCALKSSTEYSDMCHNNRRPLNNTFIIPPHGKYSRYFGLYADELKPIYPNLLLPSLYLNDLSIFNDNKNHPNHVMTLTTHTPKKNRHRTEKNKTGIFSVFKLSILDRLLGSKDNFSDDYVSKNNKNDEMDFNKDEDSTASNDVTDVTDDYYTDDDLIIYHHLNEEHTAKIRNHKTERDQNDNFNKKIKRQNNNTIGEEINDDVKKFLLFLLFNRNNSNYDNKKLISNFNKQEFIDNLNLLNESFTNKFGKFLTVNDLFQRYQKNITETNQNKFTKNNKIFGAEVHSPEIILDENNFPANILMKQNYTTMPVNNVAFRGMKKAYVRSLTKMQQWDILSESRGTKASNTFVPIEKMFSKWMIFSKPPENLGFLFQTQKVPYQSYKQSDNLISGIIQSNLKGNGGGELFIKNLSNKGITGDINNNGTTVLDKTSRFELMNKTVCETRYKHCICSLKNFIKDMDNIISKNKDSSYSLEDISRYNCQTYEPVPKMYNISNLEPVITTYNTKSKKRETVYFINKDNDNYRNENLYKNFNTTDGKLLKRDIDSYINHAVIYVYPHSNIDIPCFASDEFMIISSLDDTASFVWHHNNRKAVSERRIPEDVNHDGTLQIIDVNLQDSGLYICSVSYIDPDTYNSVNDNYSHVLSVVLAPEVIVYSRLHYFTYNESGCSPGNLAAFIWSLPEEIENNVCSIGSHEQKICSIDIHSPLCRILHKRSKHEIFNNGSKSGSYEIDKDGTANTVSLMMSVSLPDVRKVVKSAKDNLLCAPECGQKLTRRVAEYVKDNLNEVLLIPVLRNAAKYLPDETSVSSIIVASCAGGYQLVKGFCEPCPSGHFSADDGYNKCEKCPSGFKQDMIAAKACEKCLYPWTSGCEFEWFTLTHSIILSFAVLLIFGVMLCFCPSLTKKSLVNNSNLEDRDVDSGVPLINKKVLNWESRLDVYEEEKVINRVDYAKLPVVSSTLAINYNEDKIEPHLPPIDFEI